MATTLKATAVARAGLAPATPAHNVADGWYDAGSLPPGIAAPGVGLGKGTMVHIVGGKVTDMRTGGGTPSTPAVAATPASGGPTPIPAAADINKDGVWDPFFNPGDIQAMQNIMFTWGQTYGDITKTLTQMKTDAAYTHVQLDDKHAHDREDINWDSAGRGLEHSSIKDGNVVDELKNYTQAGAQVDQNVQNYQDYADTQKQNYEQTQQPYALGPDGKPLIGPDGQYIYSATWNGIRAGNASTASTDWATNHPGTPAVAATPGSPGTAAVPGPAPASDPGAATHVQQPTTSGGYKSVVKDGKYYHMYNDGSQSSDWVYIRAAS